MSPLVLAAAGGGCLVLLGVGVAVFMQWRSLEKELRRRLGQAAAPLAGAAANEERVANEESVFRPRRARSRFAVLWTFVESRYPLLDPPRAVAKAFGIGLVAAAGGWFSMWFLSVPSGWWTLPVIWAAGAVAAWNALSWLHARQITVFIRQFPDVVDQITRLSTTGVPPLEALGVTAEDTPAPTGPILLDIRDSMAGGLDADVALREAADRVRISEFTMFAAVIRLQRRSGGRVSAAFTNLAETLRERRKIALKARASGAQSRLTLLVLALMPIVVLLAQKFTAPSSVETLFNTEQGTTLLRWGVGLIVFGLFVVRSIAARAEQ